MEPPIFSYGKFPAFLSQKPYGEFPLFFLWEIPCFFSPKTLWGIPIFFFTYPPLWEIPTSFPMGNPHLFYLPPPMGNPRFFLPTPLWEIPKKNLEKNFSSGYMDNCSPKNGGAPWGEGAWGDTYPPLWAIWGGRLLIKITC